MTDVAKLVNVTASSIRHSHGCLTHSLRCRSVLQLETEWVRGDSHWKTDSAGMSCFASVTGVSHHNWQNWLSQWLRLWEGRLAWLIPDWVELDFGGVALVWYFNIPIEISYCWVITTDQFVYHWSVFVLRWPCAVARTKGRTISRAGSLKLTWIPELSRTAAAFSVSRRCVKFKWWLTCTYAFRRKLWIP